MCVCEYHNSNLKFHSHPHTQVNPQSLEDVEEKLDDALARLEAAGKQANEAEARLLDSEEELRKVRTQFEDERSARRLAEASADTLRWVSYHLFIYSFTYFCYQFILIGVFIDVHVFSSLSTLLGCFLLNACMLAIFTERTCAQPNGNWKMRSLFALQLKQRRRQQQNSCISCGLSCKCWRRSWLTRGITAMS